MSSSLSVFLQFCLIALVSFIGCQAQTSDKFWILFDHINTFQCQGVTNQASITKDDVTILDKDGKLALYLECPNEYTLVLKNIKVQKPLPNLSGEVAATLQIPLVQGPAGMSLDYPYQVIPQKKAFEGSVCDNESGVITDPTFRRDYCRYCEFCDSANHGGKKVGAKAEFGHQFVQADADGDNLYKTCRQVEAQTYTIRKTITCPGRKELESSYNNKIKGSLDSQLEQKLKMGKGRFDVYLQMYSSDTAPVSANSWYPTRKGCECCVKDASGNSNCKKSLLDQWTSGLAGGLLASSSNNCPKCNNDYVKTCLKGHPQKIGCYTVEFNFMATDQPRDVATYKARVNYDQNSHANNYAAIINAQESGPGVIAGGKSVPKLSV